MIMVHCAVGRRIVKISNLTSLLNMSLEAQTGAGEAKIGHSI